MSATSGLAAEPIVQWRYVVFASLRIVAYAWLVVVAGLYVSQRKLLFQADTTHVTPAQVGLSHTAEIIIKTPDGERLVAWWTPPRGNKPVVLDFQGQAGEPSWRVGTMSYFLDAGYGLLSPAYRGYGASTGTPSEAAIVADAKLAYDWLRARGIDDRRIVVFGESLGTGVAVQVASSRPVAGLIIDSAYTSTADIARTRFPFVPVDLLMADKFKSIDHIADVKAPLLMIHGDRDPVVPYELGRRLFEAANQPKRFATIEGGGHTVHFSQGPWAAIAPFLEGITSSPIPRSASTDRPKSNTGTN